MEIRRAQPSDAEVLTELAFTAKRYWNYPEEWLSIWRDALTVTSECILNNDVYFACDNGEIIGFYALTTSGDLLSLEHLWVRPAWIGAGVGRRLFEHAIAAASRRKAVAVEIEADPNAEGFYRRMGAMRTGETRTQILGMDRVLPRLRFELAAGTTSPIRGEA